MTGLTELRLITDTPNPFLTIREALALIASREAVIERRQQETTTLALEHEIFLSEAEKCNNILKEI